MQTKYRIKIGDYKNIFTLFTYSTYTKGAGGIPLFPEFSKVKKMTVKQFATETSLFIIV